MANSRDTDSRTDIRPVSGEAKSDPTGRKRIQHLCISVDACATLGDQSYVVIAALKQLYDHTKKRSLELIDTEQGFHEKAECTIPAYLRVLEPNIKPYGKFVRTNLAWSNIIRTASCEGFRDALAQQVIPAMVLPMLDAAEAASAEVQKQAYALIKEQGLTTFMGKEVLEDPQHPPKDYDKLRCIKEPKDIPLRLEKNEANHLQFSDPLLSQAADKVMPFWKERMAGIEALNHEASKRNEKGFMLDMIKSSQRVKAYTYALMHEFRPSALKDLPDLPPIAKGFSHGLTHCDEVSHIFSEMRLPKDAQWWRNSEPIQALRLTGLWPWTLKKHFNEDTKETLNKSHENTADYSYLRLFANILPEQYDPQSTLFMLITHDAPLMRQMLECVTGVKRVEHRVKAKTKSDEDKVSYTYEPSNIHQEFQLTKRKPEEYLRDTVMVGSEFVQFIYREALDAMEPHLTASVKATLEDLSKTSCSDGHILDVHRQFRIALDSCKGMDGATRRLVATLLDENQKLVTEVRKDIAGHGAAVKEGSYSYRRMLMTRARKDLEIQ